MRALLGGWIVLLTVVCATTGCRRKSSPSSPAPEASAPAPTSETKAPPSAPPTTPPPSSAAASVPAPGTPASKFNYVPGSSQYDDLNKHLAWFVMFKKRYPASVDELLQAANQPKPALPPGGQLVINQKTKTVDYVGPK